MLFGEVGGGGAVTLAVCGDVGGATVTVAVRGDVADADPPAFVAVTTTSIVSPTSEPCNAYLELLAPLIFEQPAVVQFCH